MANGNFAGGDGTEQNPYLIEDAFDLNAVRNDLGAHYKLINDIDLDVAPFNEGEGWVPINSLYGSLNGQGYLIKNLYINQPASRYLGLFANIQGAIIDGVGITDIDITGQGYIGGLVGRAQVASSIIKTSFSTGTINGTGIYIGGLIGVSSDKSEIVDSYSLCNVAGNRNVGGITGSTNGSTLIRSYSAGIVTGDTNVGGLVGLNQNGGSTIDSFWDIDSSGQTVSQGGMGLTTQQTQTAQTFIDAGWHEELNDDGGQLWVLKNGEYPRLKLRQETKILISSNNQNYYYSQSTWQPVGNTEQDYFDYGVNPNQITAIPSSAWKELSNPVISYYTDDLDKTQVLIETETEPFTIYDEMGDSMEVLYYTDDEDKEEAEIHIEANYSPLDEFDEFEVVTWTDESDRDDMTLEMNALPKPQFIYQVSPASVRGYLQDLEFLSTGEIDERKYRVLLSSDSQQWKTWNGEDFVDIDSSNPKVLSTLGMTLGDVTSLTEVEWEKWIDEEVYIGIYIDENNKSNDTYIDTITIDDLAPTETTSVSDAKMYILNTKSTINVSLEGTTLSGFIDDEDSTKVQYRVLLNGEPFYPASGEFTDLEPSPLNISITMSNKDYLIDENNVLRVEFHDYWGATDFWETNFIGRYSGLLFVDDSGEYYSTEIGEVLKYLDFGAIIAGQTTLEQKVILRNTYGYPVKNISIRANQSGFPAGMKAQFGTNEISFEALDKLLLTEELANEEETEFYIRLTTQLGVTPNAEGQFDIVVTADRV